MTSTRAVRAAVLERFAIDPCLGQVPRDTLRAFVSGISDKDAVTFARRLDLPVADSASMSADAETPRASVIETMLSATPEGAAVLRARQAAQRETATMSATPGVRPHVIATMRRALHLEGQA